MALARWVSFCPPRVRELFRRLAPGRLVVDEAELLAWDWPIYPERAGQVAAGDQEPEVAHAPTPPSSVRAELRVDTRLPRCLVVTGSLDVGGMDAFVEFLADGLPRHGLGVELVLVSDAPESDGRIAESLRARGMPVLSVRQADVAALRGLQADVVSIHGAPHWAVEALEELRVPMVETLHGMHTIFSAEPRQLERRGAMLEGVVAVSELVRRQYLARCPTFPEKRTTTIANGVYSSSLPSGGRAATRQMLGLEDQHLFVSLARYCLQKNTYGLVDAFCDFVEQGGDADLLVAGHAEDPRYAAQVLALKQRRRGGVRVHLRGHALDPRQLLAAADCFVLDSFFEGWSLASMEALTAGVPVISSDVGGAREQLESSGQFGVLGATPLGDPLAVDWDTMGAARFRRQDNRDALVAAFARAVQERETWALARSRVAQRAGAAFDPDQCLKGHAEFLLATRHAPGGRAGAPVRDQGRVSLELSEESVR